jgi:hypothetical protein
MLNMKLLRPSSADIQAGIRMPRLEHSTPEGIWASIPATILSRTVLSETPERGQRQWIIIFATDHLAPRELYKVASPLLKFALLHIQVPISSSHFIALIHSDTREHEYEEGQHRR